MIGANPSSNVRTVSVLVVPFVLMFGIYVAAHGHYGPGGGFAGGVIAAVAIVVVRMVVPRSLSERFFPPGLALWLMILGVGIFVGMALASLFIGGNLLDYDELPLPGDGLAARLPWRSRRPRSSSRPTVARLRQVSAK